MAQLISFGVFILWTVTVFGAVDHCDGPSCSLHACEESLVSHRGGTGNSANFGIYKNNEELKRATWDYLNLAGNTLIESEDFFVSEIPNSTRVVLLGEVHEEDELQRYYPRYLRILKLKFFDLRYLFLEYPRVVKIQYSSGKIDDVDLEAATDSYLRGEIDYDQLKSQLLRRTPDKSLLDTAKELGVSFKYVDSASVNAGPFAIEARNFGMANEMKKALEYGGRGLLIVGKGHLTRHTDLLSQKTLTPVQDHCASLGIASTTILWTSMGLLKKDTPLFGMLSVLAQKLAEVKLDRSSRSVGFKPITPSPQLEIGWLDWQNKLPNWDDFNMVVVVPPQK